MISNKIVFKDNDHKFQRLVLLSSQNVEIFSKVSGSKREINNSYVQ